MPAKRGSSESKKILRANAKTRRLALFDKAHRREMSVGAIPGQQSAKLEAGSKTERSTLWIKQDC